MKITIEVGKKAAGVVVSFDNGGTDVGVDMTDRLVDLRTRCLHIAEYLTQVIERDITTAALSSTRSNLQAVTDVIKTLI